MLTHSSVENLYLWTLATQQSYVLMYLHVRYSVLGMWNRGTWSKSVAVVDWGMHTCSNGMIFHLVFVYKWFCYTILWVVWIVGHSSLCLRSQGGGGSRHAVASVLFLLLEYNSCSDSQWHVVVGNCWFTVSWASTDAALSAFWAQKWQQPDWHTKVCWQVALAVCSAHLWLMNVCWGEETVHNL